MGGTFPQIHANMWAAYSTLHRQYGKLGCAFALGLFVDLFNTCVVPTACYGSEVWGCLALSSADHALRHRIEHAQVQMLRQIVGVRPTVSTAILFRELGATPLSHVWWLRAVHFWEGIRCLSPDNVYYQVVLDNCRDAIAGGVRNWASTFITELRRMGYPLEIRCDTLPFVDVATVRSLSLVVRLIGFGRMWGSALGRAPLWGRSFARTCDGLLGHSGTPGAHLF